MATIIDSIRNLLVPIHREGYPFIAICAAAVALLWLLGSPLAWVALLIALWVTYFFRDPPRVTPQRQGLVIAPADGRVSSVADAVPPPELGLGAEPMARVSIFMNVFDCHINRAPAAGRVRRIAYRPGTFLNAELDKASDDNERNGLVLETAGGVDLGIVQIAGLVARRIVCFVAEGENLAAGERFGLIRFGSRLDVYMPAGTVALVAEGQRAVGGETVIADLSQQGPDRSFRAG